MSFKHWTPEFEAKRIAGVRRALKGKPATEAQRLARKAGLLKAYREGRVKVPVLSDDQRRRIAEKRRGVPRPFHVVEALRRANIGRVFSAQTRARMSLAAREHIRKYGANSKSLEAFERYRKSGLALEHLRELATNRQWIEKRARKMRGKKWDPEVVEKRVQPMRGRPQRLFHMKKGPTNQNSLVGELRSPQNVVYEFVNLSDFVRNHEELFLPQDVIWKPSRKSSMQCRAVKGLLTLFSKRHRRGSWKGWTKVSLYEKKLGRMDLLERKNLN